MYSSSLAFILLYTVSNLLIVEEAAEKVAKMLGYLPLALSQAAAYIKKKALDLSQYLSRLSENLTRLISEKFSKYSDGIFSC